MFPFFLLSFQIEICTPRLVLLVGEGSDNDAASAPAGSYLKILNTLLH